MVRRKGRGVIPYPVSHVLLPVIGKAQELETNHPAAKQENVYWKYEGAGGGELEDHGN